MRPSLRFLAVALLGWAGVRAASLGVFPGAQIFRIDRSEAKVPQIAATEFPAIEPIPVAEENAASAEFSQAAYPYPQQRMAAPSASRPVAVYYVPAGSDPDFASSSAPRIIPASQPRFYAPVPALGQWPLSTIATAALPPLQSTVLAPGQSVAAGLKRKGIDRIQLAAWALLRGQQAGIAGSSSLASSGSLGASQAGARLLYNVTPQVAATLRTSSEIGRRGGEVAAGVRVQPARGLPIWVSAERRQRIGRYGGGRSAFALFFESGVYGRPIPLHFTLDAYLQGGVVGFHSRDPFIDGALTISRPVYKQFSAGLGVWGGAQPGVYRVDVGPRVSMRVRKNLRVDLDWRQRVAGNASPGSGPAVTLAGDF